MACPTAIELQVRIRRATDGAASGVGDFAAPRGMYASVGKRALDLTLVLSALPFAMCFALPIATWNLIAFRDPRRVFFVQERVGYRGRSFRMVKFRTMRDAQKSHSHSWFSGGDAARVTRFGRLLRNTHLDELPQLLNILKGDMHLVGPRPEMPEVHTWACGQVPNFPQRLAVRPGLTGLAQVTQGYTGASTACYERKLGIDVGYIEQLSLRNDVRIVGRTIPWVLKGRGWSWKKGSGASEASGSAPVEQVASAQTELDSIPAALPIGPARDPRDPSLRATETAGASSSRARSA